MSEITPKDGPRESRASSLLRQAFAVVMILAVVVVVIAAADLIGGPGRGGREQDGQQRPAAGTTTTAAPVCRVLGRRALVPAAGALFGVNLDWQAKSLERYAFDLGHKPAVSVLFANFPYTNAERTELQLSVVQVRTHGQMMLLTLNPEDGLPAVTAESIRALVDDLAGFNDDGVPVVVRFAPDMNGTWEPWGQQPAAYIAAFRAIADAVHTHAPGSAMMWAPGYGGGYPFAGGRHGAKPGTAEYAALDTNADGVLNESDDAYAPYYPGDDAVDWVGMSLYHWGNSAPWGENELPEPGKFAAQLTGNYVGANGDDSAAPDFYQVYGGAHGKPVAIAETAALFAPGAVGGEAELAIKQAWWSQVFDPANAERFPQLKMVNWFEWDREEPDAGARVDWTVTNTPAVRDAFKAALPAWLHYGPEESCVPGVRDAASENR